MTLVGASRGSHEEGRPILQVDGTLLGIEPWAGIKGESEPRTSIPSSVSRLGLWVQCAPAATPPSMMDYTFECQSQTIPLSINVFLFRVWLQHEEQKLRHSESLIQPSLCVTFIHH